MIADPVPSSEDEVRQRFLDIASDCVGLTAPDEAYASLICVDGDDVGAMMVMSGCALVVRGIWRRAGIRHALLGRYRIGQAMANLVAIAREASAYHAPGYPIRPGDWAIIASPEHVFTYEAPGTTIDGGQRSAIGLETVLRRERTIAGNRVDGRPIEGVIDCVQLARHFLSWPESPTEPAEA